MRTGSQNIYTSVKAFSQKGKLLSKNNFQILAESRDLEELVTRIKDTKYSNIISEITKPITSIKIEKKLKEYLINNHFAIAKISGENVLMEHYLRYVLWNLKFIIKGKINGKSQEEIENHIDLRAEELIKQRDIVLKALIAVDVEEAITNLKNTRLGSEITKALAIYNENKNIQIFDVYFDKILYQRIKKALQIPL